MNDKEKFTQVLFNQEYTSSSENFDLIKTSRFTQDSPIYPEVWRKYTEVKDTRVDLILTPYWGYSAATLLNRLKENLTILTGADNIQEWHLATTGENVAAKLTLKELILAALPLTEWWQRYLMINADIIDKNNKYYIWLRDVLRFFNNSHSFEEIDIINISKKNTSSTPLYSISLNRKALICIYESVPATKADAGRRVFDIDGSGIAWAVLDTGIDASHIGFRQVNPKDKSGATFSASMENKSNPRPNHSRVLETYDFTKFRTLISQIISSQKKDLVKNVRPIVANLSGFTKEDNNSSLSAKEVNDRIKDLEVALKTGRMIDWSIIGPFLRIPHNTDEYQVPKHPHGTHVAGIIGANDLSGDVEKNRRMIGMCPNINLYDIRVLNDQGEGDEFNILAAIQFVRWINAQSDSQVIHGVNLSLSMFHDVDSFASGRTPVCEACQRLVAEGTVVVAAAGNQGQSVFHNTSSSGGGNEDGFRVAGITDPGNADSVITVGATHRSKPHTYGVSFFSSKGPTGDGRYKPDLVAPGEKITSLVPGDSTDRMDGTSMAAPHVSGASALLLAKHKELIGNPRRIKEILCKTATDLGRDRYFQGSGMVDVLRALQSA